METTSVDVTQDIELAIVNLNIGEGKVSENDAIQPHNKAKKMTSMYKDQESNNNIFITTTNVGEVNEGFESESNQPKPVKIKNIDGNKGKQAFSFSLGKTLTKYIISTYNL